MEHGQDLGSPSFVKNKITTAVLAVAARKGGVGKTFAAINAAVLAACGGPDKLGKEYKVLLVDVDSQQNTSYYFLKYLGAKMAFKKVLIPPNPSCDDNGVYNITDIFMGNDFLEYPTQYGNLDIIPSDGDIDDLRKEFQDHPEGDITKAITAQFEMLIENVREDYDLIIIDTPPSKTHASQAAIAVATHVLVMAELDTWNTENAIPGIMDDIDHVNKHLRNEGEPVEVVGILPNKLSSSALTRDEKSCLEQLYNDYPDHIYPDFKFMKYEVFKTTEMPQDPSKFAYMKNTVAADLMRNFYSHLETKVLSRIESD